MATLALTLAVAGCGERVLDHGPNYHYFKTEYFGADEPTEPATPPPVRRMTGKNQDWPSLYLVPMRPPAPPTVAERAAAMAKLAADRSAGHEADEALKAIAPPPLPVPPKPEGVPGGAAAGGPAKPPGP